MIIIKFFVKLQTIKEISLFKDDNNFVSRFVSILKMDRI